MFNWLRELYEIRREGKVCDTCEVLKMENARLLNEQSRLLDRILHVPTPNVVVEPTEFKPILPRNTSWNVRRQSLEAESRRQAQIIKQREKEYQPDMPETISTADLEKELDIVEEERNAIRS